MTAPAAGGPRRNRADPFGDLHAVAARGLFTGNRGCLVDEDRRLVRHHRGSLWIICLTDYRDWRHPLDQPRTWTPIFFLDEAVALAAGHRPCGLCRREAYLDYRAAVAASRDRPTPPGAAELNHTLQSERLRRLDRRGRGRGPWLERAGDRIRTPRPFGEVPVGAVVVVGDEPHLVVDGGVRAFSFEGWGPLAEPPRAGQIVEVVTPPTSLAALGAGYRPLLHPSAGEAATEPGGLSRPSPR